MVSNLIEFCLVIVSFTIFCNPNTIWYVLYPSFTLIHQFISIFGVKIEIKSFALHKIIIFIFLAYPVDSISFNIVYPSIYKNINVYVVYLIQCAFICGLFAFLDNFGHFGIYSRSFTFLHRIYGS
jgi:hypothetical protein